jgi:hypothetical protein
LERVPSTKVVICENAPCLFNAALRALFAAIALNGNKFSKLKAPAEDRNAHQRAFEKCGSAARDGRQQGGRVEIGDMVGHEDAGSVWRDEIAAGHFDANACKEISGAHDDLRDVIERQNVAGNDGPGNEDDC